MNKNNINHVFNKSFIGSLWINDNWYFAYEAVYNHRCYGYFFKTFTGFENRFGIGEYYLNYQQGDN